MKPKTLTDDEIKAVATGAANSEPNKPVSADPDADGADADADAADADADAADADADAADAADPDADAADAQG